MTSLVEVISFTHVFCCTIFKLLAHYCARWCGHIVSGVLLRIGWRDDGHQVVSVWGVYLEIHTRMLTRRNEPHEYKTSDQNIRLKTKKLSDLIPNSNTIVKSVVRTRLQQREITAHTSILFLYFAINFHNSLSPQICSGDWQVMTVLRGYCSCTCANNCAVPKHASFKGATSRPCFGTLLPLDGTCLGTVWYCKCAIRRLLTLGSHTGKLRLLSSGCFNKTGFGHSLYRKEKCFQLNFC